VRIALALKGLSYENASINLGKGEQHQSSYGAVNPQEIVPTLEDHGRLISQSLAICEYLDETHPNPPILPRDPAARAPTLKLTTHFTAPLCTEIRRFAIPDLPVVVDCYLSRRPHAPLS
jgi:glutathione S-transferase